MKKCVALLVLLMCISLLCSCGKTDKNNTASKMQETVTSTNSDEGLTLKTESEPAKSGVDTSVAESKTTSEANNDVVTGSENNGGNTSSVVSSEDTVSSSFEDPNIIINTEEYELPFIPKK